MRPDMRVLFIENDDSFSWNVIDRLPTPRDEVRIVSGGDRALIKQALAEARFVVLGPGPLDPIRAGIVDIVEEAARRKLPLLGVCLGHQALGLAFGARLVRCTPKHGVRERVVFGESRFFPAFEGPVDVMRYHSLALADIPPDLTVIARASDGAPMAIEHRFLPLAGLQFHPDSFATPRGEQMIASFFERAPS